MRWSYNKHNLFTYFFFFRLRGVEGELEEERVYIYFGLLQCYNFGIFLIKK
jgi:hypothetical protein